MTTMGKYNNTTGLHKWCSMCACVRVCYCGFRIESSGVVLRFSHRTCICGRMHQARNDMIFFICCCNVSVTAALAGGMQQCGWYEMCTWIWRCVCTRRSFSRAATVSSVTAYSKQCITQQTLQWQGSNLIVFISANVYLHFNIPLHSIETKTISNL